MLLKEGLMKRKKDELIVIADFFKVENSSKLKKKELAEIIASLYCTEGVIRKRLVCLTEEEMQIFRKACEKETLLQDREIMCGVNLENALFGYFKEYKEYSSNGYIYGDSIGIYDDIKAAFERCDDASFREDNRRKGWLIKCIHFFINYYGVAPVEIVYEMYRSKISESKNKMLEAFLEMPADLTAAGLFTAQEIGISEPEQNSPLYSEIGLLVHLPLLEKQQAISLLNEQGDSEFSIPSEESISNLELDGYDSGMLAYQLLEYFLTGLYHMNKQRAYLKCISVWNEFYQNKSVLEVLQTFEPERLEPLITKELTRLLTDAKEVNRTRERRGQRNFMMRNTQLEGEL